MAYDEATQEVITSLFTEDGMWDSIGVKLATDSTKDDFVKRAKSWLGDNSELSGRTIDGADWDEVYAAMTAD